MLYDFTFILVNFYVIKEQILTVYKYIRFTLRNNLHQMENTTIVRYCVLHTGVYFDKRLTCGADHENI